MSTPRRFDLICFDWDGTLYDSAAIIVRCIQDAVVDVGGRRPAAADCAFVIGMSLGPALARVAADVPTARHAQLMARFRHHYVRHQDDISLFDGVPAMLARLKERPCRLAVATGKSRRGLDLALASRELAAVFDSSRTADETAGKPNPRMLHELMAEFQVAPERTLMVGDTSHDLQMAQNAGCASVGVSYGAHDGDGLLALDPLQVVHSVPELAQWLLART